MKIVDIKVERFRTIRYAGTDAEGHAHPLPEPASATGSLMTIVTDEGAEGCVLGGDDGRLNQVKDILIGEDPAYRERIWQRLHERYQRRGGMNGTIAAIDMALWDLAGKVHNQPVYKLLGGYRDKVKAYGSTMCGDELADGLGTPEAYADFAGKLVKRGYKAIKLHTWMPPMKDAPNVRADVEACRAVRERVGPDIDLMIDPHHSFCRRDALYLGRELEKLNFYWMEEPMNEYSVSSYVWLCQGLELPILGPETAEGRLQTRAEWIVRGAADIVRAGVGSIGGITPLMKLAGLAEAFHLMLELHGGSPGNLQVMCAIHNSEYFERGLLHPYIDYETPLPHLNALVDPMDNEGYVHVSDKPGLGVDINYDYIRANRIE